MRILKIYTNSLYNKDLWLQTQRFLCCNLIYILFKFASKFHPYSQGSKMRNIYQCRLWIWCSNLKLSSMEHSRSFAVPRPFKQICGYIVQCSHRSTGCQDLKTNTQISREIDNWGSVLESIQRVLRSYNNLYLHLWEKARGVYKE